MTRARRARLAHLRTAAIVSVGFVVLRVVYRLIFGGSSGGGILLIDLPRIQLPGPFAGVSLLGPITTGGLLSTTLGALPFAAGILAVGLLGVVFDLQSLVARGTRRGPLRAVSRALMIAWSTFPALRTSVLRVLDARELRGERSVASLLVPVLEQTVERAIALGASLEVRGFASSRLLTPDEAEPVTMTDASLAFEGRRVLGAVDLRLDPGSLTLVTGRTGSGKSTLLHAMSGLFQHQWGGEQAGAIAVGGIDRIAEPPRETASFVGVVPQAIRLSFVAPSVAEEVGFALAVRGIAPAIVRSSVAEAASTLGIEHLLERDTGALSAGEACLVAIAAAIVSRPQVLLVDEPLADLDTDARARVVGALDRLAHESGVCVVVAEHAIREWDGAADRRLEIADGRVVDRRVGDGAVPDAGRPARAASRLAERVPVAVAGDPVARVRHLAVSHSGRLVVDDANLSFFGGEVMALRGANGAGKSSLLHAIATPKRRGTVLVGDVDVHTLGRRARRRSVALVPEAFDDLLFTTSVAEECRRADRRASGGDRSSGRTTTGTAATFLRLLGSDGSDRDDEATDARRLLDRHPRDLSAGERLCLVIAIQLSARPRVLLIDEPTRGLDDRARALVADALRSAAAAGAAVLFATHDAAFAERVADRTLTMSAGRLDRLVEVAG